MLNLHFLGSFPPDAPLISKKGSNKPTMTALDEDVHRVDTGLTSRLQRKALLIATQGSFGSSTFCFYQRLTSGLTHHRNEVRLRRPNSGTAVQQHLHITERVVNFRAASTSIAFLQWPAVVNLWNTESF